MNSSRTYPSASPRWLLRGVYAELERLWCLHKVPILTTATLVVVGTMLTWARSSVESPATRVIELHPFAVLLSYVWGTRMFTTRELSPLREVRAMPNDRGRRLMRIASGAAIWLGLWLIVAVVLWARIPGDAFDANGTSLPIRLLSKMLLETELAFMVGAAARLCGIHPWRFVLGSTLCLALFFPLASRQIAGSFAFEPTERLFPFGVALAALRKALEDDPRNVVSFAHTTNPTIALVWTLVFLLALWMCSARRTFKSFWTNEP